MDLSEHQHAAYAYANTILLSQIHGVWRSTKLTISPVKVSGFIGSFLATERENKFVFGRMHIA